MLCTLTDDSGSHNDHLNPFFGLEALHGFTNYPMRNMLFRTDLMVKVVIPKDDDNFLKNEGRKRFNYVPWWIYSEYINKPT